MDGQKIPGAPGFGPNDARERDMPVMTVSTDCIRITKAKQKTDPIGSAFCLELIPRFGLGTSSLPMTRSTN